MNIFVPNKIRYALWHLLNLAIGWFFGYLFILILLGEKTDHRFLLQIVLVMFVVTLVLLPVTAARRVKFMAITTLDEVIGGPSVWANTTIRFEVKSLDAEKSQRRNIFQRILGYRLIVSTSGEKILFVERVFDKDQVTEILKTIGCADSLTV
ncbi:MAG TPA: hypothetical protein VMP08_17175 [Anaerolineae bacterium]|nr:hypothetical protein [Anaerolineae bacterium]